MVRISGIIIPDNKHIDVALTYLHGIGLSRAQKILSILKIDSNIRTKDLTPEQVSKLRQEIEKKYRIEGELKHEKKLNIKRLREIFCYRGLRHQAGLPSKGQRTKTNSRTVRGNKRSTMGSGRRSVSKT